MDVVARKLDDVWLAVERVLILVSVTMMTLLVGADVLQRTFSRPVGKTNALVAWVGERLAGPLSAEGRAQLEGPVGDGVFLLLAAVFFVLAAHASRAGQAVHDDKPEPALGPSIGLGLGVFAGVAVAIKLLLLAFPSSVPGAQKFALGFMLWSGMLGASVSCREKRHIILDAIVKKLDEGMVRPFALMGGIATFLFCGFIAMLGWMQWSGEVHEWATHEGVGLYESLPIPTWIATLSIPVSFTSMALRFLGYGVRDFRFGPASVGDESHGINLQKLEQEAVDLAAGEVKS